MRASAQKFSDGSLLFETYMFASVGFALSSPEIQTCEIDGGESVG